MCSISEDCCQVATVATVFVTAVSSAVLLLAVIVLAAGRSTFVAKMGAEKFIAVFDAVGWSCFASIVLLKVSAIIIAKSE